jgi:hypothetical protein
VKKIPSKQFWARFIKAFHMKKIPSRLCRDFLGLVNFLSVTNFFVVWQQPVGRLSISQTFQKTGNKNLQLWARFNKA